MTLEELMNSLSSVNIEYKYQPVNYQPIHPVVHPSTARSFLKDLSCQSNVLGADNDFAIRLLCYDADLK